MKKCLIALGLAIAVTGCAPSSYNIENPAVSNIQYQNVGQTHQSLTIKDSRIEKDVPFSSGRLPANLAFRGQPLNEVDYLSKNTLKELQNRGIDMSLTPTGGTDVQIKHFKILNHRSNGFSPFVTLTTLGAEVQTDNGPRKVGVFIKRGKVPVWSFEEVINPTLNEPLSIAVKEFSAKLNSLIYQHQVSDAKVKELAAAAANTEDYLKVYQLGFTNNPLAIEPLKKLSQSDKEYIRLAAISGLGTLGAVEEMEYLQSIVINRSNIWADRAMALKAIGDFGTDESRAFLKQVQDGFVHEKDQAKQWFKDIIKLYL